MSPPEPAEEQTTAMKFGEVLKHLAQQAGFDMDRGGTGRARLAEETGATVWSVGRWLKGETLPGLGQYQHIARALGVETKDLLAEAGIIPHSEQSSGTNHPVPCRNQPPVSPETAADLLGVTHPTIRNMLIPSMEQAQRLQRDIDLRGASGEAAAARGVVRMTQGPLHRSYLAAAGAGATAGGTIVTSYPIEFLDLATGASLPVTVATCIALVVMKRWLEGYESRTKADLRLLAEQHRHRTEELDRRETLLAARERAIELHEGAREATMRGLVTTLDTVRGELAAKTTAHDALRRNYEEVRGDYNALIEQVLREGGDRFAARADCACETTKPDVPRQGGEHQRDTTAPVTYLRPREHHPSA